MTTITCASYYGSGSSAVTDYISEFSGVKSLTDYEFRFAHDPDGLSELEYNLVENFNRHNSGHALKRYKKLVDYYGNHLLVKRYEPFFNNKWKELSYQYINDLTDFKFKGCWQFDYYDKGSWFEFWHKLPNRIINKLFHKKSESNYGTMKNCITYCSHPSEEKFLECTRRYTDALLHEANIENFPFLMVDQMLPSSNIERHMRYFSNIKAIVVDRDPRDVYYEAKYILKNEMLPSDIEKFCQWFAYIRASRNVENWNSDKILFIQFENLIYNYEETTERIQRWIGLDEKNHIKPKTYFNPAISIKNTRFWRQHPEYLLEAKEIAKRLPQYLYHYEDEE